MRNPYFGAVADQPGTVRTHEGGIAYSITPLEQLRRFLILGTLGGTFYVGEQELTEATLKVVADVINEHPHEAIAEIVDVSVNGAAPKNEPAVVALCIALSSNAKNQREVRKLAYDVYDMVIRTGTDHLHAYNYLMKMRTSSAGLRRVIGKWYTAKSPEQLAYQLLKYQQRDGKSHKNVLRWARPTPPSEAHSSVMRFAAGKGMEGVVPRILMGHSLAKANVELTPKKAAEVVADYKLTREMIPSEWLNYKEVWEALLIDMPMGAMVRNLGNMAKAGLLNPASVGSRTVIDRLVDQDRITKSRIHPMAILVAMKVYEQGHGIRGKGEWKVNARIVEALDDAFYGAFQNVTPSGKQIVLAVDSSGSMTYAGVAGMPLMANQAAAAMALITARTEPGAIIMCFDTKVVPLSIGPRQRLDDVLRMTAIRGGGTYVSLAPQYAINLGVPIEGLAIYTDGETADTETMRLIRELQHRHNTRVAGVALQGNDISVLKDAERDPSLLNVVGLDASAPRVISSFIGGKL